MLCKPNKGFYKMSFTKYCYCDQIKADNTLHIMKGDNLRVREILI